MEPLTDMEEEVETAFMFVLVTDTNDPWDYPSRYPGSRYNRISEEWQIKDKNGEWRPMKRGEKRRGDPPPPPEDNPQYGPTSYNPTLIGTTTNQRRERRPEGAPRVMAMSRRGNWQLVEALPERPQAKQIFSSGKEKIELCCPMEMAASLLNWTGRREESAARPSSGPAQIATRTRAIVL